MEKRKWYKKLLTVLLVIVFAPVIVTFILFAGVYALIRIPREKKMYRKSRYYADLKQAFTMGILGSPEYRFYDSAVRRGLPMRYVRQGSNGMEYFIYDGTVFLFPDFEQIDLNEAGTAWEVDRDGDWEGFDGAYEKLLAKLEDSHGLPVKLLVERQMFPMPELKDDAIPECIFVTESYESAFENEEPQRKLTDHV